MTTNIYVHRDQDALVDAMAARLIARVVKAQSERGSASVVLTGGRVAHAVYQAIRESQARDAIDWREVDVWWGDERFLPSGHPDRNATQAEEALLGALPLDPLRVHSMPASDGPDGDDPEAAAARYIEELNAAGRPAEHPHFDVLLLGIGEDGHVASIFPNLPANYDRRLVIAVRGAPKPPPIRISMTMPLINTAAEVWVVAAGAGKAEAVGMALHGAGTMQVPAAGVAGAERTLWLLDEAAAANVEPMYRSRP